MSRGTPASRHCSREGRLLQPDAAGAVGDRGLQRPPAAGAARADRRRGRQARPDTAGTGHRRLALPRRQQPGRARLDRRRAPQAARRRRPARLRPPSSRRRADDRPPRRARLPRRDGAGGRRRRPPARARRARQADPAALGKPAGGLPPRRRGARPRDGPDRPLPLRRGPGARGRLRGAGLADPAPCLGARARLAGTDRGRAADRIVWERQREQADPAAARGLRTAAPRASERTAAAGRRRLARLRPGSPAAAARPVR